MKDEEKKAERNEHYIRVITSVYSFGEASFTGKYLPRYRSIDVKIPDEQWYWLKGNSDWNVSIVGVELLGDKE